MSALQLRYVSVEVHPGYGLLETHFPDEFIARATRDANDVTMADAADLGYEATPDGVWRSMIDHEVLHSLVSEVAWHRESLVLRHEAGARRVPYHDRIYEEAVVLAMQIYAHDRVMSTRLPFGRRVAERIRRELEIHVGTFK